MSAKELNRLRAEATREFSFNPDSRRLFKHGFTQGWEARDGARFVLPAKVTYDPPLSEEATKDASPVNVLFAWLFKHTGHDIYASEKTRRGSTRFTALVITCRYCSRRHR